MRKTLLRFLALVLIGLVAGCAAPKKQRNEGRAHYVMGVSFLEEHNSTQALKQFLLAEKANPRDADIQAALGQSYQLKGAYRRAEKHYLRALELRPDDPQFENNLGALYLDMHRWDDAIHSFRKASTNLLFGHPEIALTGMGFAYFRKGDVAKAESSYRKAISLAPRYPLAHLRLGEVYLARGKTDQAIDEFRQASTLAPGYPVAHYKLALAYMKKGENKKAAAAFREVIRLAPSSEEARRSQDYLNILH